MKTIAAFASLNLALAACATPAPTPEGRVVSGGDDCAVIAAVAREHYRFGPDNPPPPLWLRSQDGWTPRCDWARLGVEFPRTYYPSAWTPGQANTWVVFEQPTYDGRGALVLTDLVKDGKGPVARCRVLSGIAGWTVGECEILAEFT